MSTADQTPSMPPLPTVAWRWVPSDVWKDWVYSDDRERANLARDLVPVQNLVTREDALAYAQAVADERVRAALEQAVKLCHAERAEFMEQASRNNGRQSDMAFGSVNSAERLAEAIRSLPVSTLSLGTSKGAT